MGLRPPASRAPPRGGAPSTPRPWRCAPAGARRPPLPLGAGCALRGLDGPAPPAIMRGAASRGPGPQGPHPGRSAPPLRFVAISGMRAGPACRRALFCALRGPFCAGAPAPARAAPARRARRRFAARSGPWGPRFARRARPPGLPPGSVARPLVRRYAAPRALAGPVWFGLRHPLRLRAPCSVALAPLRLRRAPARGPAGSPPPRPASRASGAAASGPGGPAAFGRGLVAAPPGALLRARACAGLLVPLSCRCACRGALPCAPPPRRPRWGAPGGARPVAGLRPPSGCAGRVPHGARFSRPTPEPGPRSGRRAAPLFRHG